MGYTRCFRFDMLFGRSMPGTWYRWKPIHIWMCCWRLSTEEFAFLQFYNRCSHLYKWHSQCQQHNEHILQPEIKLENFKFHSDHRAVTKLGGALGGGDIRGTLVPGQGLESMANNKRSKLIKLYFRNIILTNVNTETSTRLFNTSYGRCKSFDFFFM